MCIRCGTPNLYSDKTNYGRNVTKGSQDREGFGSTWKVPRCRPRQSKSGKKSVGGFDILPRQGTTWGLFLYHKSSKSWSRNPHRRHLRPRRRRKWRINLNLRGKHWGLHAGNVKQSLTGRNEVKGGRQGRGKGGTEGT